MQKKSHNKKRHRWTGKPRPGLPSSMDGRPRPTFGCPSVMRLLDVYGESETPSTSGEGEHKFTESSSGVNFPPVSGEGECEFTKSYEKKYLKKTSLWNFIWHIIYAGNREAKKPCQPVKNAGLLRPGGNYIF